MHGLLLISCIRSVTLFFHVFSFDRCILRGGNYIDLRKSRALINLFTISHLLWLLLPLEVQ
jgi:hypothetical protein